MTPTEPPTPGSPADIAMYDQLTAGGYEELDGLITRVRDELTGKAEPDVASELIAYLLGQGYVAAAGLAALAILRLAKQPPSGRKTLPARNP